MIVVELRGLRVFGHHGVHTAERENGQDFLFDVDLEVDERGSSDHLEDAVDYVAVARTVREISDAHAYSLIEALAVAVADELRAQFRSRSRVGAGDEAGSEARRPRGHRVGQCDAALTLRR